MATLDQHILKKAYRASTNWMRLTPDFMIIGAQKGGTTSLYHYLVNHPNIAPIYIKEPHFFDIYFHKGLVWYRSHFPTSMEKYYAERIQHARFITGEASPYYLFHPQAPQRVANLLPHVKLIVVLRNPVDRAYSQYQHQRRQPGVEPLSFEEALEKEEERLAGEDERLRSDSNHISFNHRHYSYKARGRYIEQLPAWKELFPQEQLLILKSEDLYQNPGEVVAQTLKFLEVPAYTLNTQQDNYTQYNKASYEKMNSATRQHLVEYFKPYNARLYEFLGRNFEWDK